MPLPPCPPWSADAAEHADPAFIKAAESVERQAVWRARGGVPTSKDFTTWHKGMFRAVVPVPYYAGGYRQVDPNRPCLAKDVAVDGLPGAPHQIVVQLMKGLALGIAQHIAELKQQQNVAPPERALRVAEIVGGAVAEFVRIHPFLNGSGRTSRLLWTVLLVTLGCPPQVAVVRRPAGNYDTVMRAAMTGDRSKAVEMVLLALMKGP